jgi:hypothetical protein
MGFLLESPVQIVRFSHPHLSTRRGALHIKGNFCPLSFIDVPKETYSQATLGVYELNDVASSRTSSSGHACDRRADTLPSASRSENPTPSACAIARRLREVISTVIRDAMDQKTVFGYITTWAEAHLAADDQAPFREMAEAELMALHEGNFARYQVRPAEFTAWQRVWRKAE